MQAIPTGVKTYEPSVCIEAVLEQTVLLHPLGQFLDSIALQDAAFFIFQQKEEKQNIITLKRVGLSFRGTAKKTMVSVSSVS